MEFLFSKAAGIDGRLESIFPTYNNSFQRMKWTSQRRLIVLVNLLDLLNQHYSMFLSIFKILYDQNK